MLTTMAPSKRADDASTMVKAAVEAMKSGIKGRLDGAYQKEGVKWMIERELDITETKVHGGILADDMGLGESSYT